MQISFDILFNKQYRWVWHLLYWLPVLVFYTFFFGHVRGNYWQTFLFVSLLLPVSIGTTYIFIYYLIPRFFATRKYFRFLLYSLYCFIGSVYLETMVVFVMLFQFIFGDKPPLDTTTIDVYFLVVGMYFVIILAVAIKMFKLWFEKQQAIQHITQEKLEAELRMLKSQIHPHFLFNTLNNIYGITIRISDKASDMILKLSHILDYLLYESEAQHVSLEKELNIIKEYIALEKIRYGDRLHIDFRAHGNIKDQIIAPMLLIPFIENCFKHGANKTREKVWIKIMISMHEGNLDIYVANSKSKIVQTEEDKSGRGLGLTNVKKRLDYIYAGCYTLNIEDCEEQYVVNLTINLNT